MSPVPNSAIWVSIGASGEKKLTRRRAAPNVTDNADESERVGHVSALRITTFTIKTPWIEAPQCVHYEYGYY